MVNLHRWARCALATLLLLGSAVAAEAVELKLTNFSPAAERPLKAWAEQVKQDSAGAVAIKLFNRNTPLGKSSRAMLQLQKGVSDVAVFLPSYYPEKFPDGDVSYLPGLFENSTESSVVMWRLIKRGMLRGFDDVHALTAWGTSGGLFIHTGYPARSLDDLSGKKIRIAAKVVAPIAKALGAEVVFMPINKARAGLQSGKIDAVLTGMGGLFSQRLQDVTHHHLEVPLGGVLFVVAIRKDRYDNLPRASKAALTRKMGETFARAMSQRTTERGRQRLAQLKGMPGQVVRKLMPAEQKKWLAAGQAAVDAWVKADPMRQKVLDAARREASKFRGGG